jgi:UrcA family protein
MFSRVPRIVVSAALLMASFNFAYGAEVVVHGQVPLDLEHRSELVAIGDLNLRTESGQATLMGRIDQAVKHVCGGPLVDLRNLPETRGYHACDRVAMRDATSKAQTAIASANQSNESIAALMVVGPAKQ